MAFGVAAGVVGRTGTFAAGTSGLTAGAGRVPVGTVGGTKGAVGVGTTGAVGVAGTVCVCGTTGVDGTVGTRGTAGEDGGSAVVAGATGNSGELVCGAPNPLGAVTGSNGRVGAAGLPAAGAWPSGSLAGGGIWLRVGAGKAPGCEPVVAGGVTAPGVGGMESEVGAGKVNETGVTVPGEPAGGVAA